MPNDDTRPPYPYIKFLSHIHLTYSNETAISKRRLDPDHLNSFGFEWLLGFITQTDTYCAFTDHSEVMSGGEWRLACKTATDWQAQGLPCFSGFEWTKGSIFDKDCTHIIVINTSKYAATQALIPDCDADIIPTLNGLYTWLNNNLGEQGFWGFPHPWAGEDPYDGFKKPKYQKVVDRCCFVEIGSELHKADSLSKIRYFQALQAGLFVVPWFGPDNWGKLGKVELSNFNGIVLMEPGRNIAEKVHNAILKRRVFYCEKAGGYLLWSIWNSKYPDKSKTWMGGTYHQSIFGKPDRIKFYLDQASSQSINSYTKHFIYKDQDTLTFNYKKPSTDNDKSEELFKKLFGYGDDCLAIVIEFNVNQDRTIMGAPIWID